MEKQAFYANDIALLEISTGVFTRVKVVDIKRAYGNIRYVVVPTDGIGELTVEKLTKNKK